MLIDMIAYQWEYKGYLNQGNKIIHKVLNQ